MARKPGKWKARGLTIWDVRKDIVADLTQEELTLEEIAAKHKVSFGMVRNANEGRSEWIKTLGFTNFPIRERYTEKSARAKQMLLEGVLDTEVAESTNLQLIEVVRIKLKLLDKGEL